MLKRIWLTLKYYLPQWWNSCDPGDVYISLQTAWTIAGVAMDADRIAPFVPKQLDDRLCSRCQLEPLEWAEKYCQECWEQHCSDAFWDTTRFWYAVLDPMEGQSND